VDGSASISSAFTSSESGIASTAPKGPRSQAQNTRDRKVSVVDRPTASPTTLGWMIDWMMKLITLYATITQIIVATPWSSRPSSAGGTTPMKKPTFGM
jgi:hypothetical protein